MAESLITLLAAAATFDLIGPDPLEGGSGEQRPGRRLAAGPQHRAVASHYIIDIDDNYFIVVFSVVCTSGMLKSKLSLFIF